MLCRRIRDPVILERVNVPVPLPPTPPARSTRPSGNMYQTPNRRARSSLHREVLIRSVQRAVMAREEEREEKEVEDVIVGEEAVEECEEYENEEERDDDGAEHAEDNHEGSEEDGHSDTDEATSTQHMAQISRCYARTYNEQDQDQDQHVQMDTDQDAQPPPPSSSPPAQIIAPQVQPHLTPARAPRPLGSCMTPQVPHPQSDVGLGVGRGAGCNSFGGALGVPIPPGVSAPAPSGA
ncbi:hypothetical protein AZE42_11661, partial [Rhizopogon vesiculosus]